jgi:hypothetical protein
MEGDTPSFFGLINNGLGWYKSPAFGGWAGRYEWWQSYGEVDKIWTSSINTQDEITLSDGRKEASNQATIWRWRRAFQHDFAARMDWNVAEDFNNANHNPILRLNGNEGKALAFGKVDAGKIVRLSAKGIFDPDGDQVKFKWWIYKEAGGYTGDLELFDPQADEVVFDMPALGKDQTLHIILEVEDSGSPSLVSYRRVVLGN